MSHYIGELDYIPDLDARRWRITHPFCFDSDLLQVRITIPAGFNSDGASVPRPFWSIIPPWGRYGRPAVVHDYMYRWRKFSRRQADDVLLEGMWASGCAAWQFATIFTFVRLFGWYSWNKAARKPLSAEELLPNDPVVSLIDAKAADIDI